VRHMLPGTADRMNFPPQDRSRPLAPNFLGVPPMRFRSLHTLLRNRLAYMARRENSPSEYLCQIVSEKRPSRLQSFKLPRNGALGSERILCVDRRPLGGYVPADLSANCWEVSASRGSGMSGSALVLTWPVKRP